MIEKDFYVLHLCAPNDTNGNPRRCYVVQSRDGVLYKVIDEGYGGWGGLRMWCSEREGSLTHVATINVPVSEYKSWLRAGKEVSS